MLIEFKRWPIPNIGHAFVLSLTTANQNSVHPLLGDKFIFIGVLYFNICGWIVYGSAYLISRQNRAADTVAIAQQFVGFFNQAIF